MEEESSVKVALRIRPTIPREIIEGCSICTSVTPGQPQVCLGEAQSFTFDYVFDTSTTQSEVFSVVEGLVDGCIEGYNATILAYGQTGSGKTFTMGSGFDAEHKISTEVLPSHGIIPRAVHHLFHKIHCARQTAIDAGECPSEFAVTAQFVELHNEEINDLIGGDVKAIRQGRHITIKETGNGVIYLDGVIAKPIHSAVETLKFLRDGALVRSTAATNMNDSSSRSHAIFTIKVVQKKFIKPSEAEENGDKTGDGEFISLQAKFHFVDLAGSERLKRTGAIGERAKEGIAINCGLLALGNVISALGDKSKKSLHVPYRDSKLTRLLQDSLGGNSRTLMIACISPSDKDFVETLNTLKYANRARNIKNKITINQDKSSRLITSLKQELAQVKAELLAIKQGKITASNGQEFESDLYHENLMLTSELENLRTRLKAVQETLDFVTAEKVDLLAEKTASWFQNVSSEDGSGPSPDLISLVKKYTQDIEELRSKLIEAESTIDLLKKKSNVMSNILNKSLSPRPNQVSIPMSGRNGAGVHLHGFNDYGNEAPLFGSSESISNLVYTARNEILKEKRKLKLKKKQIKKKRRSLSEGEGMEESVQSEGGEDAESGTTGSEETSPGEDPCSNDTDDDSEEEEDDDDDGTSSVPEELAAITDQINTKQRLIEQLVLSNQRALETKESYEQQIACLVSRIKSIESERDHIMKDLKPDRATPDKIKQIKEQYELKLANVQKELAELKEAQKQHNILLRKNASTEKQVASLRSEVDQMKRLKVKLQNQIKEENVRFREAETRQKKEILQLKKEQRLRDVQIRDLETKQKLKDQILKRKHEEVAALKKSHMSRRVAGRVGATITRSLSSIGASGEGIKSRHFGIGTSAHGGKKNSPKRALKKWSELQQSFQQRASEKKLLDTLEMEMMKHIEQRKEARWKIEYLENDLESRRSEMTDKVISEIEDELESLRCSVNFSEEKISTLQRNICEASSNVNQDATGGKNGHSGSITPHISLSSERLTTDDCEYLMNRMYEYAVEKQDDVKETTLKLSLALEKNEELSNELLLLSELMTHVYAKYCADDPNLSPDLSVKIQSVRARKNEVMAMMNGKSSSANSNSLRNQKLDFGSSDDSKNPALREEDRECDEDSKKQDNNVKSSPSSPTSSRYSNQIQQPTSQSRKARRLTSTPAELMGDLTPKTSLPTDQATFLRPRSAVPSSVSSLANPKSELQRTQSARIRRAERRDTFVLQPGSEFVPPGPPNLSTKSNGAGVNGGLHENVLKNKVNIRRANTTLGSTGPNQKKSLAHPAAPQIANSTFSTGPPVDNFDLNTTFLTESMVNSSVSSAPNSPNSTRRAVTSGSSSTVAGSIDFSISNFDNVENVFQRLTSSTSTTCAEPSEGIIKTIREKSSHNKLFQQTHVAEGHSKAVLDIFATEDLLFTGGKDTTIKIWDLTIAREKSSIVGPPTSITCLKFVEQLNLLFSASAHYVRVHDTRSNVCVKTLSSSGICQTFEPPASAYMQTTGLEHGITSMAVSYPGNSFYTSYGNVVKLWDLRTSSVVGNLPGRHSSSIMCLAVQAINSKTTLVTGSKDHSIKVFQHESTEPIYNASTAPKLTLSPPHYDGVESFALSGSTLYSGSRDNCIKKWDLSAKPELLISYNNAHSGWVTGLCLPASNPNILVSVSRDGSLKAWDTESTRGISAVEAHRSGVNCVTSNSSYIFTGSKHEGVIGFWKIRKDSLEASCFNQTGDTIKTED